MDTEKIKMIALMLLQHRIQGLDVGGHGIKHFMAVGSHAVLALLYENLSDERKLQVELAAYLHDIDDEKIFPESKNYQNARFILDESLGNIDNKDSFIETIIDMIDLVSCSKNGDRDPPEPWMAIPRDCDRLEAIGKIGIDRCLEFTTHKGLPLHLDNTPRALNMEEVWNVATPERFKGYMNGVKSVSMIDHYYDKLLHIGNPDSLKSQNEYILGEAVTRNNLMAQYVIDYWKSNISENNL